MSQISIFGMHVAHLLGFAVIADVRGCNTLTELFANKMQLSGIYLQIRPERHLYIGQTVNMLRRFTRHLDNDIVIEELAFMPTPVKSLDKRENELIEKAQRLGFELDNLDMIDSSMVRVEGKLEDFLTPDELDAWLNYEDQKKSLSIKSVYDQMPAGLRHQFNLARQHPLFTSCLNTARVFVQQCLPKPQETAGVLWSTTAYTTDLTTEFIPLIRIHLGTFTLASFGFFRSAPSEGWVQLSCQKETLLEHDLTAEELSESFPYTTIFEDEAGTVNIAAHARMMKVVIKALTKPLRTNAVKVMRRTVIQNGNPALESILTNFD